MSTSNRTFYAELHDPEHNHHKFYQMQLTQEAVVQVLWGRIGSKAQTRIHEFGSMTAAELFFEAKAAKQLAKGYKGTLDQVYVTYRREADPVRIGPTTQAEKPTTGQRGRFSDI